jgi:hypothetical protein
VLKAARLYDGKSDRMVSPGWVLVRGNRIDRVGAGSAIPLGSTVIELGDATAGLHQCAHTSGMGLLRQL